MSVVFSSLDDNAQKLWIGALVHLVHGQYVSRDGVLCDGVDNKFSFQYRTFGLEFLTKNDSLEIIVSHESNILKNSHLMNLSNVRQDNMDSLSKYFRQFDECIAKTLRDSALSC
jgi:hypothetical protein